MKRFLLNPLSLLPTAVICLTLALAPFALGSPIEDEPRAPKLKQLVPAGGQRGTRVETVCKGDFTWPVQVSAPGVTVEVGEEKGKLTFNLPADLATDRIWVRLYNAQGASTPIPFLVGSCLELSELEPNNSLTESQKIDLASQPLQALTINGVLHKRGEVDAFHVQLQAGDTLVAALDANQRLGSPIDAILQVVSPAGAVVAENHDAVGLDPRIAFQVPTSGKYTVRVFAFAAEPNTTIAYHGGDDCLYRLTLATGPYITHALPFAAPLGANEPVQVIGWNIPAGTRLPIGELGPIEPEREFESLTEARATNRDRLGFVYSPSMAGSARIRLTTSAGLAPNSHDFTAQAADLPLAVPSVTAGRLQLSGQKDFYRLILTKDVPISVLVEAQCLELPTVPWAQLSDPSGKVVAEVPEGGSIKDAVLTHTPGQSGEYRLQISDRFGHGGDWFYYRLTVRPQETDFDLSCESDSVVVTADNPAEINVSISRRPGAGPAIGNIKIEAVDLPAGVSCLSVLSEATGESAKKVKLTLVADAANAYSGPIRIHGISEQPIAPERFARTPPQYQASFEAIWLTVR